MHISFFKLNQVRELTEEWMDEYSNKRPHKSLKNPTPNECKMKQLKPELITFKLSDKRGTYTVCNIYFKIRSH